jgi:hypothetical protein
MLGDPAKTVNLQLILQKVKLTETRRPDGGSDVLARNSMKSKYIATLG